MPTTVRPSKYAFATAPDGKGFSRYFAHLDGNTLVLSAVLAPNVTECVKTFNSTYLFSGATIIPDSININEKYTYVLESEVLKVYSDWDRSTGSTVFESSDLSLFFEKQNADLFRYENGKLRVSTTEPAVTFPHFYAKDGSICASFKPETLGNNADFGVSLHTNSDDAWLRGGYDAKSGRWYIAARQGSDFFPVYLAEVKADVKTGESYEVTLTSKGNGAELYVNGSKLLTTYNNVHTAPGKAAIFAEDVTLTVESATVKLTHNGGTLFTDIYYNVLPYDKYIEGGQVYVMKDGSLIYQHHSGTTFRSTDDGKSWVVSPLWTNSATYVNITRLNNGDFMKIINHVSNGGVWFYSLTSSDEGKTWKEGGNIAPHPYPGTNANATNMNDKIFESPNHRPNILRSELRNHK